MKMRAAVLNAPIVAVTVVMAGSVGLLLAGAGWSSTPKWDFTPPDREARRQAIGSLENLDEVSKRAFEPGEDFKPITAPGPGDWLDAHEEPGQTFDQFVLARRNVPRAGRRTIYFLPLGTFAAGKSPPVETLREIATAYFGLPVKLLPAAGIAKLGLTTRVNSHTGKTQVLTKDVLSHLETKLPPDAYCLLGITMTDLYPAADWNFVFGAASLRNRVGVYSFARFDPAFYGKRRGDDHEALLLRRCAKVLVHETAHMFGILHCIYFSCILNGSNHLTEADSREIHLCPVCLRKLKHAAGFDIVKRYDRLAKAYASAKLTREASWARRRATRCRHGSPGRAGTSESTSNPNRPR